MSKDVKDITGESKKVLTYDEAKAVELSFIADKPWRNQAKEFDACVDAYILDDNNKCLVKQGKINVYEKIQSNADCALDVILNKFLDLGMDVPNVYNISVDNDAEVIDSCIDDKDKLYVVSQYKAHMDELRTKYNVPDGVSDEVFINALNKQVLDKQKELEEKMIKESEKVQGGQVDEKIQTKEES